MHKEEPILSFTSHKTRIPLIDEVFKNHIEVAKTCGMRVCFACQDDALPSMTEYQKSLVSSGEVELLHTPKDHGSNTKWTLCRQAHPNAIMVVVDDDWIYDTRGIKSLLETAEKYPDAIICRAYRSIPWVGGKLPLYKVKPSYTYPKTVTAHIKTNLLKDSVSDVEKILTAGTFFPEHFLGILYPPQFPKCSPSTIPQSCYKDDDVFIGARAAAEGREVVFAGRSFITNDVEIELPNALWSNSRAINGRGTYNALKSVENNFVASLGKDRLGQVILMTCKKYPLRRQSIVKEMERLGIDYIEHYDDGTMYSDIGFEHKKLNRCHLAKFLSLQKFLDSHYDRVTLIEDDVRFLKSIATVASAIEHLPSDFGACRLSWGVSPYIRSEIERKNPELIVQIECKMLHTNYSWVECPWASTDGCTIISREVALKFYDKLLAKIESHSQEGMDNSDDMLCRICSELNKPLYAYKPLVCIQVQQSDVEKGKSIVDKFLDEQNYHIPGVVQPKNLYEIGNSNCGIIANNGYRIGTTPKVYYGHRQQSNLNPRPKGWNW